jgi:hypothetical protein
MKKNYSLIRSKSFNHATLDADIPIESLDVFNDLLNQLLQMSELSIDKKIRKVFEDYLKKDKGLLKTNSGFLGLVSRLFPLVEKYKSSKVDEVAKKEWDNLSDKQKSIESKDLEKKQNDITAMHRFSLILKGMQKVSDSNNRTILFDKIKNIVNNELSESYFSDIFELYIFISLKNKGVEISFLKPQKRGRNTLKTCDYKFNETITADCKCLIGNVNADSIIKYCNQVVSQIGSTIGYEGIDIGGVIICLRDSKYEYLMPLRQFSNGEIDNLHSGERILQFVEQLYSDIFMDRFDNEDKIKFLMIYYIPSFEIDLSALDNITPQSITTKNEFYFIIITKFCSDEEFDKIKKAFEIAVPMFIRFK